MKRHFNLFKLLSQNFNLFTKVEIGGINQDNLSFKLSLGKKTTTSTEKLNIEAKP